MLLYKTFQTGFYFHSSSPVWSDLYMYYVSAWALCGLPLWIWRYLPGLDWLMVGVRSGWAGWTLLKPICSNEKQAEREREEKEGGKGERRALQFWGFIYKYSPAALLWVKLKLAHSMISKTIRYMLGVTIPRLPLFMLENENMSKRMCLRAENSSYGERNVSWDAW